MNGEWYELFVKAGGLFSDSRYDTRVCASDAREVRHNALYRRAPPLSSAQLQRVVPEIASSYLTSKICKKYVPVFEKKNKKKIIKMRTKKC